MEEDVYNMAVGFAVLAFTLIVPAILVYPTWRCLRRAGYKPAWSLLILIPGRGPVLAVGIFGVLAFAQWPVLDAPPPPSSWRAFSRTEWVAVSEEQAKMERYYGMDGMLLAMYGLLIVSVGPNLLNLFNDFNLASMQTGYGVTREGAYILSLSSTVWMLALLVLIPMKRSIVPLLIVAIGWFYVAEFILVIQLSSDPGAVPVSPDMPFAGSDALKQIGIFSALLSALFTTWYWLKSKRVNVTYHKRVPAAAI